MLARDKTADEEDMPALDNIRIGMTAEIAVTVTPEMTVGHFVAVCRRSTPRRS
jgi:hypothetical protein